MKTILVDDELWSMEQFEIEASGISGVDVVGKFQSSSEALEFAGKTESTLRSLMLKCR